jgi:hypothetical protein
MEGIKKRAREREREGEKGGGVAGRDQISPP